VISRVSIAETAGIRHAGLAHHFLWTIIMNTPNLLLLILSRSDHLLLGWVVLVALGFAVMAVLAALPAARSDVAIGRLFVVGWLLFAVTHLLGMLWIVKQWAALERALQDAPSYKIATEPVRQELARVTAAPDVLWIVPFHLAYVAFVLIAIWWLTRTRSPMR
jgi:hypothetical protein